MVKQIHQSTHPARPNIDRGEWMISSRGRKIYPLDIRPEDVDIEEIAHALSNLCRFGGHCLEFYSVAQHSFLVSCHCPPHWGLEGLLHDAPEAYLGDAIRPLKRALPAYREIEARVWSSIAVRFGLGAKVSASVKEVDNRVLMTERRDLIVPHEWPWMEDADGRIDPYPHTIQPLAPRHARDLFLGTFEELTT